MTTNATEMTVGELVTERPARSRVFEKHGVDYCCGGKKSLAEACGNRGLSVDDIVRELGESDNTAAIDDAVHYEAMALDELADHIVDTHHAYLGVELPRLDEMAQKVAKVHGETDARLLELALVVRGLVRELVDHMMKEEQILFPFVRQLAQSDALPAMPFGTMANSIAAMEAEHDNAGGALESLRTLTDGYNPPDWACNTYRALLDGLHELELDLHQHIHKENNILFPGALKREAERS
jgi:regulator of cell morphogenesis and NO signaling